MIRSYICTRAAQIGVLCAVEGCQRERSKRGWCNLHYQRWRRTGEVGPAASRFKAEGTTQMGYDYVNRSTHPLASSAGRVLVHRMLLFDAIGPGAHPCHWCGHDVTWRVARPQPDDLVVDHLDFVTNNNSLDNLVPSCRSCNSKRQDPRKKLRGAAHPSRRKVACPQGHPYNEENTAMVNGYRVCRICRRSAMIRHRDRARQAEKAANVGAPEHEEPRVAPAPLTEPLREEPAPKEPAKVPA